MNNSALETRIENLERRLNHYRLTSVMLGLGLIGLAGIAAAPTETQQEVRAHRLVVVDAAGKEVGHFASGPNGGFISLLNNMAIPVIRIGAGEKGGRFTLTDAKGEQVLQASSDETGGELMLQDKKGQKNVMRATSGRPEK
jgi:hypothetical protein